MLPKIAAVGLPAAMPGLFQQGQCDVMYTNTQTVATLKGKGVDVEFVKPESGAITFFTTMHIAKGTGDLENAYKYLDVVISKEAQEALTKPPYNFLPVNKDVPLARRHADEEPRRDGRRTCSTTGRRSIRCAPPGSRSSTRKWRSDPALRALQLPPHRGVRDGEVPPSSGTEGS